MDHGEAGTGHERARVTDSPVHQWIDRWESRGLLTDTVARELHEDVDAAGEDRPEQPRDDRSAVERALAVARGGILEALGYLGAAVTLGAFAVLLDLSSWTDSALIALTALVALVTGVGVFWVTPVVTAAGRRLAGVLGFTSVAATATTLVQGLESDCVRDCTYWQDAGLPFVIAAVTIAVAAVLYRRHVHLLTHAALGASTAGLAVTSGLLLAGPGADTQSHDVWIGVVLLVASLAWVWACETERLRPAWLGTLAAGAVSYSAAFMITSPWADWFFGTGADDDHEVLAVLALATAYTIVGSLASRLRPTIVGAAGLAVSVPWTLTDVFGLTPTATAGVLLPVGILLTVWAIMAGRRPASDGGT